MIKYLVMLLSLMPSIAFAAPSMSDVYDSSTSWASVLAMFSLGYIVEGHSAKPVVAGWVTYFVLANTIFDKGRDFIVAFICAIIVFAYLRKRYK